MKQLVKLCMILGTVALVGCNSTNNKQSTDDLKLSDAELEKVEKLYKKAGYKCKKIVTTGTRLKQKVCSTKEQRRQAALDAERVRREMIRMDARDHIPVDTGSTSKY